jgi:ankyrin repeat protein
MINEKKRLISICLLTFALAAMLAACGARSDETTPEMAENMLKLRGYKLTEEDFFRAINMEDAVAVRGFLQAGINANAKNEKGETALNYAILYKDPKIAALLMEKADLNARDDAGNMPLFVALKNEKEDLFKQLLEKGADPNSSGTASEKTKNQTVLYVAILQGREDLIQTLLDKGADPNIPDSTGALPLSEAVLRRGANPRVVKMLLDKGADPNAQEADKVTPLMYAAENNMINPETRNEIVQMLLDKGADKTIKDKDGKTALDWAKKGGNKNTVELLQK